MRRCLTTFIVVLLALRGLLGDAVAMQLMQPAAAMALTPSASVVHSSHHTAVTHAQSLPSDSHRHTAMNADTHCTSTPLAACSHSGDDSSCTHCVLCHTAWGMHQSTTVLAPAATPLQPRSSPTTLVSAPTRSPLKPPIV